MKNINIERFRNKKRRFSNIPSCEVLSFQRYFDEDIKLSLSKYLMVSSLHFFCPKCCEMFLNEYKKNVFHKIKCICFVPKTRGGHDVAKCNYISWQILCNMNVFTILFIISLELKCTSFDCYNLSEKCLHSLISFNSTRKVNFSGRKGYRLSGRR